MEILNNIWTVLITPNEFNTKLITSPFTFIEAYIGITLFLTFLNIPSNKKTIYILTSASITIINSFLIPNPFCVFIDYLLYFILIIVIFKMSPFKSLMAVVSPIAIFGIISTLIINPYLTIFNITSEQLSTIPIYNCGYLFCLYIISFILVFILKLKNFKITLLENIDTKNRNIILTNSIFGIFNIMVQGCIIFYFIDVLPIIITFLSCISLLVYYGISIQSITKATKLTLTTKKLESAEEYNKTLRILHDNVRGFKHDFDNIVTTIGGYVRTNDMDGLKHYYIQLEDDCQRVNNLYLLNPEIINNPRYIQFTYK